MRSMVRPVEAAAARAPLPNHLRHLGGPMFLPELALAKDPRPAIHVREDIRSGRYAGPTAKLAPGFLQANMVTVECQYASDFLQFVLNNPKPCPLLDVVVGPNYESRLAPGSDLRCDIPKYRVWHQGNIVDEPTDATSVWPKDAVSFLLGCSFTFENDLKRRGLLKKDTASVPMYKTNLKNTPSGPFGGNLVVSMRLFNPEHVRDAIRITEGHALSHGGPVAVGHEDREALGILDLSKPDYGEAPQYSATDNHLVPLFWACGVTPQSAIEEAGARIDGVVITHSPGCMFITDVFAGLEEDEKNINAS